MNNDREIGGYFELESSGRSPYHGDCIALNSCRSCFAYLIKLRHIETIWIPYFMCHVVPDLFRKHSVTIKRYRVNKNLLPDYSSFEINKGEFFLLADFYGQLRAEDVNAAFDYSYGNLLVDETHGYFVEPWSQADTAYSCRKWFGVSDGAFLRTSDGLMLNDYLDIDSSRMRMNYILGRTEESASKYYSDFKSSDDAIANHPVLRMSSITWNMLSLLDYDYICERRSRNWSYLHRHLGGKNLLALDKPVGPFMYPLLVENAAGIREQLASRKIYVPMLWPNVIEEHSDEVAVDLASKILPLPIDQRYEISDMEYVLDVLNEYLG